MYTCICVLMCVEVIGQHWMSVSLTPSGIWGQGLSATLDLTHSDTLLGPQAAGICLSLSPWCWDCRHVPLLLAVFGSSRDANSSSIAFRTSISQTELTSNSKGNLVMSESLQFTTHHGSRTSHASAGQGSCHHRGCWVQLTAFC